MRRIITFGTVLLGVLFVLAGPGYALTITDVSAFVRNRPADDIYGHTGLTLEVGVSATDPGGTAALTGPGAGATATASNLNFPFTNPFNLVNDPLNDPVMGGVGFDSWLPITQSQFPNITGTYTTTVTNTSAATATITSHNLDKLEVLQFPTNLAFSNNSTTPVFSFKDANGPPGPNLLRQYVMRIYDDTKSFMFIQVISSTPSFTVPAGALQPGEEYFFRAEIRDSDTTEPVGIQETRESASIEYATFQPSPVPEPNTLLLLGSGLAGLGGVAWRRHRRG